jgi:hypothetical protein
MEPAEIWHRLVEHRRKAQSRRRDEGWQHYPARTPRPVFPSLREAVLRATSEQRQAIAAAAENTLAGRFSALGGNWPERDPATLFPQELWRMDPVTGKSWAGPETYTFDVDFRHNGSLGDIKYVWEINRLQMLPPLAAHLALTGDDRCLTAVETAIDSWHAANPPFRGVSWASGIEVALRAISLLITLELSRERLSARAQRQLGEILAASAYWLPRFPSKFSSANNHLVAELAGEYLIGVTAATEVRAAQKAIITEVRKQILPDGAGAEQSPTYAAFTAELVLVCALAARSCGRPFPAAVEERLAAFADFIAWLPNGSRFGDDDEGRVLTSGDEPDYLRSVAAAIHSFLGQPAAAAGSSEFRTLVFGPPSAPTPAPQGLRTFPDGGLSIWRGKMNGRVVDLSLDHGPLGYLAIAAHGHADALSLTLDIDGQPVLVDPGTYLYGSGGAWRDWFRSTPAHNTLNIEGQSQSIIAGAFNWSHKAETALIESRPGPDWLLRARHDGYRGRFGVLHERAISRQPDGILVTDRLQCGTHLAEIVFQLAAGLTARRDHDMVIINRGGEPVLNIRFPDDAISIAAGGDRPGQGGWVSPRFGVKVPAERIAWRGEVGDKGVQILLTPAPSA